MSLQDLLPSPTLLPTIHEVDLFRSVLSSVLIIVVVLIETEGFDVNDYQDVTIDRLINCEQYWFNVTFELRRCFQSVLVHLHVLWELMLLGEPLVIMAPSPTVSSETVLALVR